MQTDETGTERDSDGRANSSRAKLRMSTEHQKNSPDVQASHIAAYAAGRGYKIVRTYSDLGVTGLHLKTRKGLRQLLADAVSGSADFSVILVYDVAL